MMGEVEGSVSRWRDRTLVPTMENMESSQGENGMPNIICEIWKIKRPSPFEGDAPSIYGNERVNGLLMKQSEWSAVTLINEGSYWTLHLVV